MQKIVRDGRFADRASYSAALRQYHEYMDNKAYDAALMLAQNNFPEKCEEVHLSWCNERVSVRDFEGAWSKAVTNIPGHLPEIFERSYQKLLEIERYEFAFDYVAERLEDPDVGKIAQGLMPEVTKNYLSYLYSRYRMAAQESDWDYMQITRDVIMQFYGKNAKHLVTAEGNVQYMNQPIEALRKIHEEFDISLDKMLDPTIEFENWD